MEQYDDKKVNKDLFFDVCRNISKIPLLKEQWMTKRTMNDRVFSVVAFQESSYVKLRKRTKEVNIVFEDRVCSWVWSDFDKLRQRVDS